jgi:predicted anti-sigma-YlaC factor YlaD
MNCNDVNAKLADLLFEETPMIAKEDDLYSHLAECQACRGQLAELRSTMALLDTWEAPEPNPYFLTRLNARLDEEREAAPASWYERLRARLVYGSRLGLRPVAAMALSVMVLLGGGAYLGLNTWDASVVQPVHEAAVVNDLQTMDNNAQLLDQLEALSNQNND